MNNMNTANEFRDLLKKLKTETASLKDAEQTGKDGVNGPLYCEDVDIKMENSPLFLKSYTAEPIAEQEKYSVNVWDAHKEVILFGMLCSIVAVIIGILVAAKYITFAGTAGFGISFIIMIWSVFSRTGVKRKNENFSEDKMKFLAERVSLLEQKISAVKTGGSGFDVSRKRAQILEEKIEELRVLVKALIKSVESK